MINYINLTITKNNIFKVFVFLFLFAFLSPINADSWRYIRDNFGDSTYGSRTPNSIFEMHGLAMKQEGSTIYVAINSNMPLAGTTVSGTHIGWGDFIMNFGNLNSYNPNDSGLYAVHFAGSYSDSGVQNNGFYSVTTKSVTSINLGYNKIQDYLNVVGTYGSLGGFAYTNGYFDLNAPAQNSIKTGSYISAINLLNATQLLSFGLDFATGMAVAAGDLGSQTFGFSFTLPGTLSGNFIAHLAVECANDMMAFYDTTTSVPEPASLIFLLFGLAFAFLRAKK